MLSTTPTLWILGSTAKYCQILFSNPAFFISSRNIKSASLNTSSFSSVDVRDDNIKRLKNLGVYDQLKGLINDYNTATNYKIATQSPLLEIKSGVPWVMPLNWYYEAATTTLGSSSTPPFYNGSVHGFPVEGSPVTISLKQPILIKMKSVLNF